MLHELLKNLPDLRGKMRSDVELAKLTWFRVGGRAEVVFKPADIDDLIYFLKNCPLDIPITTLGATSNLIIRDGGIKGVVIRMGRAFADIKKLNEVSIYAGAAALDINVANFCANKSLGGLEFLSGIPGTIGGGVKMNAGAYGVEFKDILLFAEAVDRKGNLYKLTPKEMNMQYRCNNVADDIIFTGAVFKTYRDDKNNISKKMADIKAKREASQPIKEKTGGSTFANPNRNNPNIKENAWQLIDKAGCRGLQIGGAKISNKHCNFIINTDSATATDIENLGEEVKRRVKEKTGIDLKWEIKRIGQKEDFSK